MKANPVAAAILALLPLASCSPAWAQLAGEPYIHDPSTVVRSDGKYYTFGTGGGGLMSATRGMPARSVPAEVWRPM